jgi:hypothetical protein
MFKKTLIFEKINHPSINEDQVMGQVVSYSNLDFNRNMSNSMFNQHNSSLLYLDQHGY